MNAYDLSAWIEGGVRWIHVFAAIMWIGQTYLFNFFERNLKPDRAQKNVIGKLGMVHGGGFYFVEKHRMSASMPPTLHWFKWEAAITWISGVILITLTYYRGGLLVDADMDYTIGAAAGIGTILVAWLLYDGMVRSPLGKHESLFSVLAFVLTIGIHYGLTQVLSSRAAFIHIGAMFGTLMAANVWLRILPSQRKMIEATKQGLKPDTALMTTGPLRSKHNSYMVVSLVFIMISNHYPTISYGHDYSSLVLGGIVLVGWGAAKRLRG